MKKILLVAFILFQITSCATTSNNVELFFVKENSLQYFFPAIKWHQNDGELILDADLLYRTYAQAEDNGEPQSVLNFSLFYEKTLYQSVPQQVAISVGDVEIIIPKDQISIIFIDKGFTRYSCTFPSHQLELLMKAATDTGVQINLSYINKDRLDFLSPKEFYSHIQYFQEVILGIVN